MGQDLRQTIIVLICVSFGMVSIISRDFVHGLQEARLAELEIIRVQATIELNKTSPESSSRASYLIPRKAKQKAINKVVGGFGDE